MQQRTNILLVGGVLALALSSPATADWFGSSNYDDCMLEKMKGQGPYMLSEANDACRLEFPLPRSEPKETLLDYDGKTIHYTACSGTAGEFKICVVEKPDNYVINRVVGHFAIADQCTYEQTAFTNVLGSKAWFKDTYSFNIERNFNCSYFSFYGLVR